MKTIVTEIEGVINNRPLTYVYDDTEGVSYPLTPSQMISGRNVLQVTSDRHLVSTYESLCKRANYYKGLLSQFTKRWKQEYLVGLMESYRTQQNNAKVHISTGDMVILKKEFTKRTFWKLAKVLDLIKGANGEVRAAKIQVSSETGKGNDKILLRPLQHLVPLEISSNNEGEKQTDNHTAKQSTSVSEANARAQCSSELSSPSNRQRRNAAVIRELLRTNVMS